MKNIILCEGKTDAILYSYYLIKVCGWKFIDESHKKTFENKLSKMNIDNAATQASDWYFHGDDILCIYTVGSKDNFADGLKQIVDINLKTSAEKFTKIVVLSDRDDSCSEDLIIKMIKDSFSNSNIKFKRVLHNEWNKSEEYENMGETYDISVLPLVIPFEESGTIETFMLNCRKEINIGENALILNVYHFIDELIKNDYVKNNYLSRRGFVPKAKLGVYFSVVSPNRTFDVGNKILESIPWEKYTEFQQTLQLLSEI